MEAKGMTAKFGRGICSIFAGSKKVAQGTRAGNIYMLDIADDTGISCTATISMETWHARLGHSNFRGISNMISTNTITGIDPKVCKSNLSQCEACIYGKSHRVPFEKSKEKRASGLLDLVHSDVCGPMQVPSMGGSRYFVTFTDDHSKWSEVFCMKMKSDVLDCFKIWQKRAERHTGCRIRALRSDNGGEYLSRAFKDHLMEHGITHQLTVPYTPQQNGTAERLNRTLLNSTRSMLKHMNCDKLFWAEAVNTACYIKNRVTTTGLPNNTTPHEIWNGKKPDVGHLRVFGSKCWYTIPKESVKKLDDRTSEAIMIGYPKNTKGYKLWDINAQKVVISRDVLFEEVKMSTDICELEDKTDHGIQQNTPSIKEVDSQNNDELESVNDAELEDVPGIPSEDAAESMEPSVDSDTGVRRSTRIRNAPGQWWANTAFIATYTEPKTFRQAITGEDAPYWKSAMSAEYQSLMKHNTWNLVPRPQNRNIVSCKWIFKTKEVETDSGNIDVKYKARLVAKGYSQVQGVDYEETFAPVVKFTSVRILLAIVALLDLELHQMDVVTAFLNGDLNEEIFMEQPEGFGAEDSSQVCKLVKSLYGLKQAPRQWHAKIDGFLVGVLEFSRNVSDECFYVRIQGGIIAIIALYVDDLLIACNNIGILNEIKKGLSREFEMKDMGQARMCLGFRISRNRSERKLTMSQEKYALAVLSRFGMSDANGARTPMEVSIDVDDSSELATNVPYREAIGSLMYLMVGTRPDIAFAVSRMAKYVESPTILHWKAVKHIMRYIRHTSDYGLEFGGSGNVDFKCFCDSDWGGDTATRKSTSGYIFCMAGGAISWSSKKQAVVALSSTESEYVGLSLAAKEAVWLRRLVGGIGISEIYNGEPVTIFADNQGSIKLAENDSTSKRTKHIDIRYHFTKNAILEGEITLKYCNTTEMVADMMTKPLGKVKLEAFSELAGLVRTSG
jgi:Reverse transcriptase (RNA-dependent DNA polymerase)/Integrase core domain/GAG-pre-integrase domain